MATNNSFNRFDFNKHCLPPNDPETQTIALNGGDFDGEVTKKGERN